jgi:hypothetical protein
MNNNTRYNIIGFYPKRNDWCLIALGNTDKEYMLKRLEDVKNNLEKYIRNPQDVTEIKLDGYEESGKEWWNGNLD